MGRQVLAVFVGVALSVLASAASGYFLYRLSNRWPNQIGTFASLVFSPLIALVVGLSVGALAKSRPGTLAAISLVPWAVGFPLVRRHDLSHMLIPVLLVVVCGFIGVAAARLTHRIRKRNGAA